MDQLLLKPEDAARALSLGRSKLHELVTTGELPAVRIGRATRIPASALQDWVQRQAEESIHRGSAGSQDQPSG